MKTHPSAAFLPFLLILISATPGSGQPSSGEQNSDPGSETFFLYVDYCGNRYNKSIRGLEMIITAVKLPGNLLQTMPRLKDDGRYSSRNRKISVKQQEIIKKFGGEKMIVRVNKNKFNAFYPKGLKKGFIIESDEFNRWNFRQMPAPEPPPVEEINIYDLYRHWFNACPVNIRYGFMFTA